MTSGFLVFILIARAIGAQAVAIIFCNRIPPSPSFIIQAETWLPSAFSVKLSGLQQNTTAALMSVFWFRRVCVVNERPLVFVRWRAAAGDEQALKG